MNYAFKSEETLIRPYNSTHEAYLNVKLQDDQDQQ